MMVRLMRIFKTTSTDRPISFVIDICILLGLAGALFFGIWLAFGAPASIEGPEISLDPAVLPRYAVYSLGRMFAAYLLSMAFSLVYGSLVAKSRHGETVLLPILDVLQSVPILSFLPVVLLSLTAILPEHLAVELASIVLIFTSQAWNLTFAWYQSQVTIPKELEEAGEIFRFNPWMRFKTLDMPFAAMGLIWNSVMSWAGGWFFLMAAEIFTVGNRDFRLPGLGSFLQAAAAKEDYTAIAWGLAILVTVIVALDQFVWRPLLAWGDRFTLTMVSTDSEPTSWFFDIMQRSKILGEMRDSLVSPMLERLDLAMAKRLSVERGHGAGPGKYLKLMARAAAVTLAVAGAFACWQAGRMLLSLPLEAWSGIGLGLLATFLRVMIALIVALAWTLPLGVAIGSSHRLSNILQPLVQIAASIPATAVFPIMLMFLVSLTNGLNAAAVLLMLMGTQWYLLFNIIAGASTIPQDLKDTSTLLGLSRWTRWRTLILPALFPYVITGAITAGGGAWNASIVSEYVSFGGNTFSTTGIGAIIAQATASGDYPLLLAGTLAMVLTVVLFNRLVWRRLFRLAEDKFRME